MQAKGDQSHDRNKFVSAFGSVDHDAIRRQWAAFPTSQQLMVWVDRERTKPVRLKESWISDIPSWLEFAVCIPVHEEAEALPATLAALDMALRSHPKAGVVVLLVNDTLDSSADIARAWALRTSHACVIVEVSLDRTIRNAPHARRLALEIGAHLCPAGALLTTDADTLVAPDWITTNLQHLDCPGPLKLCHCLVSFEGFFDGKEASFGRGRSASSA